MAFALFRRKHGEAPRQANDGEAVYRALMDGLAEMERCGVDRAILTVHKTEPSHDARGRWLSKTDYVYHPFDTLGEAEQGMIAEREHYQVVALVRDNVGGAVRYPDKGVEVYRRTRIVPLLPKLKPESELHYVTDGGAHTGEGIKQFAQSAAESGWNSSDVRRAVEAGIQEYKGITTRLMEKGGVYRALEQMEERRYTPSEQMMADMRKDIASAASARN
jgi:hypothetical protein